MASEKLNMIEQFKNLDILKVDRRTFLKAVAALGATSFVSMYGTQLADALAAFPQTKVLWLHGAECTGCSESALNAANPEFAEALSNLNVSLEYHETLLAPQGIFVDGKLVGTSDLNGEILLDELVKAGGYVLVVEGSIGNGPDGTGKINMIGTHTFKSIYEKCAKNAAAIIALGTCATYGGITVTDCDTKKYCDFMGVNQTEDKKGGMNAVLGISNKPVINLPGCPAHPDWFFLTVAAVILGKINLNDLSGILDDDGRPKVFYPPNNTLHDNCPRRGFYDRGVLDERFAEGGCLWKVGCKAPYVHADCALRKWNNGTSLCMQAGGPCIACVEPIFPNGSMPYFTERESAGVLFGINIGTVAALAIGAAVVAAGVHAVRRVNKEK
ncbi:Periplasmic [NiFeSe] hydrogenase small subunit [Methanimicrococcus hongohii]|uniref:Periplasmic [NiFeSe] hydrogenase small subunit n=1 Tax=Methanimicrococcus hongohii TaxID=3028295 RepID=A0AA96UZS5_9EURY|nr:hydrogenase small subunit [Methanimicrococcus sp. Hf6]WNY23113.1 Periplasmic [NiFeSe] hydrogenase small subunit [Methanimicrococcus sp. Hf6]